MGTRRTTCQECGKPITQAARGKPRLYCSTACRNRASIIRRGLVTITVIAPMFNRATGQFDRETFVLERSSGALDSIHGHGPGDDDFGGILDGLAAPAEDTGLDRATLNSLPPIFEGLLANEPEDKVEAMLRRLNHALRWWRRHGAHEPLDPYLRPLVNALIAELRGVR